MMTTMKNCSVVKITPINKDFYKGDTVTFSGINQRNRITGKALNDRRRFSVVTFTGAWSDVLCVYPAVFDEYSSIMTDSDVFFPVLDPVVHEKSDLVLFSSP